MQLFWGVKHDNSTIIIEGEEVVHLNKSLRKQQGDLINLIDGSGAIYKCELGQMSRNQAFASIVEIVQSKKKWLGKLHLAIALTKNIDRIEWFVEKSVEMGVDEISFINCERSVKTNIKIDRIKRIVQSSMKQSLNCYLTLINNDISFNQILENTKDYSTKLIPHCENIEKVNLSNAFIGGGKTIVLIGPEGDFTSSEVNLAIENGFSPASMGETRLRTETAGMMTVAIYQSQNWR